MKTKMTKDIVPEGFTMRLALVDATAGHLLCRKHDPDRAKVFKQTLYAWGIALPDWRHGESPVEGHSCAEEEKCLAAICSNAAPYAAWVPAYDLLAYYKCRSN